MHTFFFFFFFLEMSTPSKLTIITQSSHFFHTTFWQLQTTTDPWRELSRSIHELMFSSFVILTARHDKRKKAWSCDDEPLDDPISSLTCHTAGTWASTLLWKGKAGKRFENWQQINTHHSTENWQQINTHHSTENWQLINTITVLRTDNKSISITCTFNFKNQQGLLPCKI